MLFCVKLSLNDIISLNTRRQQQHGRQHDMEKVLKKIKITIKLIIFKLKLCESVVCQVWEQLYKVYSTGFDDRSTRRRQQHDCWLFRLHNFVFSLTFR